MGSRSLTPREHGAYGQLGFPLATSLLIGRPGAAAVALAVCAVLAFLAHEPLLVALGQRGSRVRREHGPRALRRLLWLGCGAAGALALGLRGADETRWAAVGLALAVSVVALAFLVAGREKSVWGELVAALALVLGAVPVALAGGVPVLAAVHLGGVWGAFFTLTTLSVRSVTRKGDRRGPAALGAVVAVAGLASAAAGMWAWSGALALLPPAVASVWLAIRPPPAKALRQVGWALVAAGSATLGVLLLG